VKKESTLNICNGVEMMCADDIFAIGTFYVKFGGCALCAGRCVKALYAELTIRAEASFLSPEEWTRFRELMYVYLVIIQFLICFIKTSDFGLQVTYEATIAR
jgi:hypothetical protein